MADDEFYNEFGVNELMFSFTCLIGEVTRSCFQLLGAYILTTEN